MKSLSRKINEALALEAKKQEYTLAEIPTLLRSEGWIAEDENPELFDYSIVKDGLEVEDEKEAKAIRNFLYSIGFDVNVKRIGHTNMIHISESLNESLGDWPAGKEYGEYGIIKGARMQSPSEAYVTFNSGNAFIFTRNDDSTWTMTKSL